MSISVTRDPVSKPVIKFKNNPSIRTRVPAGFGLKESQLKNCRFYMVDGSVSKPSEIMKLLNKSFENKKTNYFLVCKSFNEEIMFTLKENYDRSITNVIPLEYGFDLDSINCLPDLASVVGGQPFSPALGDVLSTVDLNRMGSADTVEILRENVVIRPSVKQNKNHIRNLLKNN
jgi:chaperonin GroEL (HSP60 family)